MREIITPDSEAHWLQLRTVDVTSTEVACLFGCSPYITAFELWNRKRGNITVDFQSNERVVWGQRLQDSIAWGVAQDEGWVVQKAPEYIRDTELRAGSSFDFWIGTDGILEIKNVDALQFRDGWIVDGDQLEAPPGLELQIQHQLMVSGRKFAVMAALVGGNRVVLIRREPDEHIIGSIRDRVASFWASIEMNSPPAPQFPMDADTVMRLHGFAEPGKIMQAHDNKLIHGLAIQYRDLSEQMKQAEDARRTVKAQIIMQIGDCEKVLGEGFTVSAGVQGPSEVAAHTRAGFRRFGLSWRQQK